jgi:hypothetical protein
MLTHVSSRLEQEITQVQFKARQQKERRDTDAARKELERLNILFQKGRITESYYDEQYEQLEKKIRESEPDEKIPPLKSYDHLITAFSGNWQELYATLDKQHRQTFWKGTIRSIEIDPETHKISGFSFLTELE